ncbi:hypothetical protein [Microbispora sp. KK1-11]|uniref:hypothetical protein n=1 Tax=Microbispora sp. KK1-11 TaxID=2053005 RepID=UPI001158F176|nr:hypothetical protein [Microbispora sp. KK1-11]TQS24517.1 hypothetical protein FLW16_35670 [Microbispora sp. KK1-11]
MELARLLSGMTVSILIAYSLPWARKKWWRTLLATLSYGAYTVAPIIFTWKAAALLATSTVVALYLARVAQKDKNTQAPPAGSISNFKLFARPMVCLVIILALTALIVNAETAVSSIHSAALDNKAALIISGALFSTFIGGEFVTHLLRPFTEALGSESDSNIKALKGAGALIGWLERSLIFGFVIAGKPEGAALVVAVKALARFPELKEDKKGFIEYFLIGTMSSLAVAVGIGWWVRTIIT